MKINRREVNVFSMSALDLFASALGAFILVAVVLFPYFPNTGMAEADIEELNKSIDDATKQAAEFEQENSQLSLEIEDLKKALEEAESDVKGIKLPPLDLVIALDSTGSMGDAIKGLKNEMSDITKLFSRLSPDFAMGLIEFKDICHPPTSLRSLPLQKVTAGSAAKFPRFANDIYAGNRISNCNNTGPENLYEALQLAVDMNWRSSSESQVIVVVSDYGPYEDKIQSSLQLANSFGGRTEGSKISSVFVKTHASAEGEAFLRRLAEAGQGTFTEGGGSMTAALLLALLDT